MRLRRERERTGKNSSLRKCNKYKQSRCKGWKEVGFYPGTFHPDLKVASIDAYNNMHGENR